MKVEFNTFSVNSQSDIWNLLLEVEQYFHKFLISKLSFWCWKKWCGKNKINTTSPTIALRIVPHMPIARPRQTLCDPYVVQGIKCIACFVKLPQSHDTMRIILLTTTDVMILRLLGHGTPLQSMMVNPFHLALIVSQESWNISFVVK